MKFSILKEDLKNQIYWKKVYCFLCSLAFYETDGNKFHDFFVIFIYLFINIVNFQRMKVNGIISQNLLNY